MQHPCSVDPLDLDPGRTASHMFKTSNNALSVFFASTTVAVHYSNLMQNVMVDENRPLGHNLARSTCYHQKCRAQCMGQKCVHKCLNQGSIVDRKQS